MIQTQGDFEQHRQPARPGHPGQRLFSGAAAQRRTGLHARRQLPGGRAGTTWSPPTAMPCSRPSPFPTTPPASPSAPTAPSALPFPASSRPSRWARFSWPPLPIPAGSTAPGRICSCPPPPPGDAILGTPGGSEGLGTIQQGELEQSNVNVVEEFIEMILAQRSYESNSKVVQAADQMFQDVNSMSR